MERKRVMEDARAERKEEILEPPRQVEPAAGSYDQLDALHAGRTIIAPQGTAGQSWLQDAWDWMTDRVERIVESVESGVKSWKVRRLKFNKLPDGRHISVRAETPPGTRIDYRRFMGNQGFPFEGTRYNPGTVAARTGGGLLKGAVSKGSLALAGVVSLGQNLWQFGADPAEGKTFWDRTVKNREFWVSTGVDFAVSVAVGVAAAAVVAGLITLAAGTTLGAVIALPAVAIGATAIVGGFIGWGIDATDFPVWAKTQINGLLSK